VIPLLSVFLVEIAGKYKNHHQLKKFLPVMLLFVLTLAGYFFYNRFLFLSHGSMFLKELMPPKS
jgi:cytochrome c biogenesis protein CcdA